MGTLKELGFESYPEYLEAADFRKLTVKLIYSNPNATCWICERTWHDLTDEEYLLLHHVSYINLGKEKIKRDVYILCNTCHRKVHFYWFFGKRKTKLIKRNLLKRMRYLKMLICIQKKRFWAYVWYGSLCIMS